MKFSTSLIFATAASAATLAPRQRPTLAITDFTADCIPHSVTCTYGFTVNSDPSLPAGASTCGLTLNGPDKLPDVAEGTCEDNLAYHWSVARDAETGGLDFSIWYPFNSRINATYCHAIAPADLEIVNGGAVQTEHYVGAKEFEVSIGACFE
jgi:hypothetical protein